jgi:hypothetical protein
VIVNLPYRIDRILNLGGYESMSTAVTETIQDIGAKSLQSVCDGIRHEVPRCRVG